MNGETSLLDLRSRVETFRRSDNERDNLMQFLADECHRLKSNLGELENDFNNEKMARRHWQSQCEQYQRELQLVKNHSDNYPFALALIDGDGAIFQDDLLYAAKSDGGSEAAFLLLREIKNSLQERYANSGHWSIVVNIYANFEDLSRKLAHVGIFKSPSELHMFARAFSISQALFNFVDVGRGKERADHKIKEMFRLFVHNTHCKSIVFGGCHDNGYLPNLEPYKRDESVAERMTLLESTPAEWQYRNLGFPIVRFPNVFRSQPLPDKPASIPPPIILPPQSLSPSAKIFSPGSAPALPLTAQAAQPNPVSPSGISPLPTPAQPPTRKNSEQSPKSHYSSPVVSSPAQQPPPTPASSSYAKIGGVKPSNKEISIAPAKPPQRPCIFLNKDSQRLDPPLPKPSAPAEARLKFRINAGKVCNMYHLFNKCKNGHECRYQHGERLGAEEQVALKHKTRTTPCSRGANCFDISCISGHHCPNPLCDRADCYFEDAHYSGELARPRLRLFEDGNTEFLK